MRSKKAALNMMAAIIELVVATVASFIVPHYIIYAYGSSVNGLVSSITQFLHYIALVESGIGAIGRASLYRPLADGNNEVLSGYFVAIDSFYKKVAYLFIGYVAILAVLFPLLVNKDFEWSYTAILIAILAFSTFIQYFFGITSQTLLQADQKKYIPSLLQSVTLILNVIFTIVLVEIGSSIHVVKIGSAAAFTIRPIVLYLYVKRQYEIDKRAKPRKEILKQRWDGLAQHIAFFIHKNTDVAVLTVLANIKEVSVYSVYNLAVAGCSKVVNIFSSSLEPAFGNMIAKGEKENLKRRVSLCSTITFQAAIVLFSTAAIVISPFVQIYTRGVTDINYMRPTFGIIMLIAEAFYCIRLPYQSAVYAAGHFRQTRNGAIIEAFINITMSVILVFHFGLIGVAIGTLVAMLFRTVQYILYYYFNLIEEPKGITFELKRLYISIVEIAIIALAAYILPEVDIKGYWMWFVYSVCVGMFCLVVIIGFSYFYYREQWNSLTYIVKGLLRRSK